MTNADKYLKDGVSSEELIKEIDDYVDKRYKEEYEWFHSVPLFRYLEDFLNIDLNKPIKPTLTEEEKVILKNIDTRFTHISRDYNDLFITVGKDTKDNECILMQQYNHLFGFIKNGEEYEIKELLGDD